MAAVASCHATAPWHPALPERSWKRAAGGRGRGGTRVRLSLDVSPLGGADADTVVSIRDTDNHSVDLGAKRRGTHCGAARHSGGRANGRAAVRRQGSVREPARKASPSGVTPRDLAKSATTATAR